VRSWSQGPEDSGGGRACRDIDRRSIARKSFGDRNKAAYLSFDDCGPRVRIVGWVGATDIQLVIAEDHVVITAAVGGVAANL